MFLKRLFQWSAVAKLTVLFLMPSPSESNIIDLAFKRRTYLSSVVKDHYGRFAVDGDFDSYAHAYENDSEAWFVVDLDRPYQILNIFVKQEYNLVVGLLNDFDPKMKTDWRKTNVFCSKDNLTLQNNIKLYACDLSEHLYRYIMLQPGTGENDVIIYELKVIGISIHYYGCYEKTDIVFSRGSFGESVEICLTTCEQNPYAVIKDEKCFCASNIDGLRPLNECSELCYYKIDYCGGPNAYSVYKVNNVKEAPKLNHHCKHGEPLDDNGFCKNGLCEDGWTGDSCSMRDCSVHNGSCEHHTCTKVKMASGMTGECICSEGYDKQHWWESCEEVDECQREIDFCNVTTAKCPSLSSLNFDPSCIDAIKCIRGQTLCNVDVANCTNTMGSFNCICLEIEMKYDFTTRSCIYAQQIQLKSSFLRVGLILTILLIALTMGLVGNAFLS